MSTEILDRIDRQNQRQTIAVVACAVVSIVAILVAFGAAKKPPIIVRVDSLGKTESISNYHLANGVIGSTDVEGLTRRFLSNYVGLRSDIVAEQVKEALNVMTLASGKAHLEDIVKTNLVERIQAQNVRNEVEIPDVSFEKVYDEYFVNADFIVTTKPIDRPETKGEQRKFKANLVLKQIERSVEQPFGLLVDSVKLTRLDRKSDIQKNLKEVQGDS